MTTVAIVQQHAATRSIEAAPVAPSVRQPRPNRKLTLDYAIIFGAMFSMFLVAAMLKRVLPSALVGAPDFVGYAAQDQRRPSVVAEAIEAAATYTPFAFIG